MKDESLLPLLPLDPGVSVLRQNVQVMWFAAISSFHPPHLQCIIYSGQMRILTKNGPLTSLYLFTRQHSHRSWWDVKIANISFQQNSSLSVHLNRTLIQNFNVTGTIFIVQKTANDKIEILCEENNVILEQAVGPWVYFAFGVNVSAVYDSMAKGLTSYRYQIEDPLLRSDIHQVDNSGCGDRKLYSRMCIGPMPSPLLIGNKTLYTFPYKDWRDVSFDLELTCNNTCVIYIKGKGQFIKDFFNFNISRQSQFI